MYLYIYTVCRLGFQIGCGVGDLTTCRISGVRVVRLAGFGVRRAGSGFPSSPAITGVPLSLLFGFTVTGDPKKREGLSPLQGSWDLVGTVTTTLIGDIIYIYIRTNCRYSDLIYNTSG